MVQGPQRFPCDWDATRPSLLYWSGRELYL